MGKKYENWIKKLEAHKIVIGKERDALDEVISDAEELKECCMTAYENIQCAIDALSELT